MAREIAVARPTFDARVGRIRDGLMKARGNFADIGLELKAIHDEKSYRPRYKSFEAAVRAEFGMSRALAYRLIDGADILSSVLAGLKPGVPVPIAESQLRPLKALPASEQAAAWEEAATVTDSAGTHYERPTEAVVRETVIRRKKRNRGMGAPVGKIGFEGRAQGTVRVNEFGEAEYDEAAGDGFRDDVPARQEVLKPICQTCDGGGKCPNCGGSGEVDE